MSSILRKLSLAIRAATDQRVEAPVPVTRSDDIVGHTVMIYEGKSVRRYNFK